MSIDLSYQRFRDCLQLTTHLLDKRGEPIASGESLTLRIKATNLPRIEAHREPLEVAFSNPRVFVRGTNLAAPTKGPVGIHCANRRWHRGTVHGSMSRLWLYASSLGGMGCGVPIVLHNRGSSRMPMMRVLPLFGIV